MKNKYVVSVGSSFGAATFLRATILSASCLLLPCGAAAADGASKAQKPTDLPLETMNPKQFSRPVVIDNNWMPMKPGTRLTYAGTTAEEDGKVVPHRIVITVTDLTKVIGGVRTLASYDLDYKDKDLEEAELAFYAQADDGTVWRFGEYPEEYEDEKFSKAPAWIHGFEGARAGIMMPAKPRLGTSSYAQGWGPAVNWTDRGQIYKIGQTVTVKAGKYDNVLVVKETSSEEPDAYQLKYYAPGVGNVKVGWGGSKEKSKEVLDLVKIEQLSAAEMAKVRKKALALEQHAYQRSKNVYAKTPPMEIMKK